MARTDNAFNLSRGQIELTAGVRTYKQDRDIYLCMKAGELKLTYADGSTETVVCPLGFACTFDNGKVDDRVKTVEVLSGTFSIGD